MSFRQSLTGFIVFISFIFSFESFASSPRNLKLLTKRLPSHAFVQNDGPSLNNILPSSSPSTQLRSIGRPQEVVPIFETGFFWNKIGNQKWELNLFVKDQDVTISAMTLNLTWNAKSYLETIQSGPDLLPDTQTNALDWFSMPHWHEQGNVEPNILPGYTVFADGKGGYVFALSSFTRRITLRSNNGQGIHFSARQRPYQVGIFKFFDGNSYLGWINNPKIFLHSTIATDQASYEISSYPNLTHPYLHMVDANQDNQEDFEDFSFIWNYFFTRSMVSNLSMFQFYYDPRLDVDEDGFMNFIDLRTLGRTLNEGRYIGDTDGDGDVDQNDQNIVATYMGASLFQPDGGYDIHYPWFADLNGDLEVNSIDLSIVSSEFGLRYF